MPIVRKPGWYKDPHKTRVSHYFDQHGVSWCNRWRGHGILGGKPKDTELCKDCCDNMFRFKKAYRNGKSVAKLKIRNAKITLNRHGFNFKVEE